MPLRSGSVLCAAAVRAVRHDGHPNAKLILLEEERDAALKTGKAILPEFKPV